MDINNEIVVPSRDYVPLSHKQFFPNNIGKNTLRFSRKEDMILMCLSLFIHDYVHDYNLGKMHARVIKGNIMSNNQGEKSLFESLGITIGKNVFKIFSYFVGVHRDISMYNDEQFIDDNNLNQEELQNLKNYFSHFEVDNSNTFSGGGVTMSPVPKIMNEPKEPSHLVSVSEEMEPDKNQTNIDIQQSDYKRENEDEDNENEDEDEENEDEDDGSNVIEEISKTIYYDDIKHKL